MGQKRTVVETVDPDGQPLVLAVLKPSNHVIRGGQRRYNLKLAALVRRAGEGQEELLSRHQLDSYLSRIGVWTSADQVLFQQTGRRIRDLEREIRQGGIKLSDARAKALKMRELRDSLAAIYAKRQAYESVTMEQEAENDRFKYLMTQCVVHDDTSEPFFKNDGEYERLDGEECVAEAAKALAADIYGYDFRTQGDTFECSWLREHKFMNEGGALLNIDGQLVDYAGRRINDQGHYIDDDGRLVDIEGRRVDEDDNIVADDPQPYLDDTTGEPIVAA